MKNYYKAAAGFLAAVVIAYMGSMDGGVTGKEWLQILLAGLGGSGLVYIAPRNVKNNEAGEVDLGLILLVLTFVGVVLLLFRVHFGG